jgi:hypothetical protein
MVLVLMGLGEVVEERNWMVGNLWMALETGSWAPLLEQGMVLVLMRHGEVVEERHWTVGNLWMALETG